MWNGEGNATKKYKKIEPPRPRLLRRLCRNFDTFLNLRAALNSAICNIT